MDAINDLKPHSITEITLFTILCAIVIIFINLMHYTNVQRTVKQYSRCYKSRAFSSGDKGGEYTLTGYTTGNVEIIRITYDFKLKISKTEIKAPDGTVFNQLQVKMYNLKTYEVETLEKTFYSNIDYKLLEKDMIYDGTPELVRFIQFGNTDFFERQLFS